MTQTTSQSTSQTTEHEFCVLAQTLFQCTEEQFSEWLYQHQAQLSLGFLQYLKETSVTSTAVLRDSSTLDRITRYTLQIAAALPDERHATALAQWMRGLWAMHNQVAEAVTLFKAALSVYELAHDRLSVAKLSANLVGVLADSNENREAEKFYQLARTIFLDHVETEPRYLVVLEQNFGYLLHYWGRYEAALAVHDRAFVLASEHELTHNIAAIRVNRHLTLGRLGRLAEVEVGFLQDRELAERAELPLTVARIDMDLGELYTSLGQPMKALRHFQQATQALVPMEQGPVLATQATLLRHLGAFPAARRHYETALTLLAHYGLRTVHAETLVNLAICLRWDGDAKDQRRARKLLVEAEAVWQEQQNPYGLIQVYFERILLAQALAHHAQALSLITTPPPLLDNPQLLAEFRLLRAETYRLADQIDLHRATILADYEAAFHYAAAQGMHWLRRDSLSGLGKIWLDTDWPQAQQLLEAAATADDQMRQMLSIQELKASFHRHANDLYHALIRGAFAQQADQLVLHYSWRAKAGALFDLAQLAHEQSENEEAQQRINALRQQIAALRWSLAIANKHQQEAEAEKASPELNRLIGQLLELRMQRQSLNGCHTPLAHASLQQVSQKLDADLLIEYVRCGHELYGICVQATGAVVAKRLIDCAVIEELAGRLVHCFESFQRLHAVDQQRMLAARIDESRIYLTQCYNHLVAPLLALIPDPIRKILIAPCDLLAMLPFAAFWTGERYWVEEAELELIQCGMLLQLDCPLARDYTPPVVIAAASGDAVAVRAEAHAVAACFQRCTLFVDTPALTYLQQVAYPPRLVHIAAHTIQRGDAPLFTGIQLAGEVLSVEASYELPLWGTELVTLSGCTTAGGMESDASLFAFQTALLMAGAQRVLCTLWPIADGAAERFMVAFYTFVEEGLSIPSALRKSYVYMLAEPASQHPALWAAFTLVRR